MKPGEIRRKLPARSGWLEGLNAYPNGGCDLRQVLADKFELDISNVLVRSGSDSIMANIVRTFLCDDDEVLTTESAFIGFQTGEPQQSNRRDLHAPGVRRLLPARA